ncbi:hypothetical protein M758_8G177700 [Ceratodon purpureus]|nr:hypothetical protein M758_8G177700 [Ceratodon purpureus]
MPLFPLKPPHPQRTFPRSVSHRLHNLTRASLVPPPQRLPSPIDLDLAKCPTRSSSLRRNNPSTSTRRGILPPRRPHAPETKPRRTTNTSKLRRSPARNSDATTSHGDRS